MVILSIVLIAFTFIETLNIIYNEPWKLDQKNVNINTPAASCGGVGCARNIYCMQKYPSAFAGGYFCFAIRW